MHAVTAGEHNPLSHTTRCGSRVGLPRSRASISMQACSHRAARRTGTCADRVCRHLRDTIVPQRARRRRGRCRWAEVPGAAWRARVCHRRAEVPEGTRDACRSRRARRAQPARHKRAHNLFRTSARRVTLARPPAPQRTRTGCAAPPALYVPAGHCAHHQHQHAARVRVPGTRREAHARTKTPAAETEALGQ